MLIFASWIYSYTVLTSIKKLLLLLVEGLQWFKLLFLYFMTGSKGRGGLHYPTSWKQERFLWLAQLHHRRTRGSFCGELHGDLQDSFSINRRFIRRPWDTQQFLQATWRLQTGRPEISWKPWTLLPWSWPWCPFKSFPFTFRFFNGSALYKMKMALPSQRWNSRPKLRCMQKKPLRQYNIHFMSVHVSYRPQENYVEINMWTFFLGDCLELVSR